ncbi:MAG: helix-turn-helix domain-containing protein [Candidatus Lambdaproteobacteria bacterium]|nr:helix-turn-helix domain-containing protein [Candidatus Lambdaproteobacteria bacterium]
MGQVPTAAAELFAEIGLKLRAVRESQGLTLQEISSRTRINPAFLKKIEDGQLEGLPALAFVRGFVRNYMQVLELDDPQLSAELLKVGEISAESSGPSQPTGYYDVLTSEPSVPVAKIVVSIVVVLLLVWAAYLIYRVATPEPSESEGVTAVTPADSAPAVAAPQPAMQPAPAAPGGTNPARPGQAAPTPPGGKAPAAVPAAEARQGLRLTVRGLEPTWVRLSVDRATPVEVMLKPAETMEWDANEEFRLTIGKSHGVAVYLNGEEILLPEEPNRLIPGIVLNKLTLLKLEN